MAMTSLAASYQFKDSQKIPTPSALNRTTIDTEYRTLMVASSRCFMTNPSQTRSKRRG
jgi:hypothetical protein